VGRDGNEPLDTVRNAQCASIDHAGYQRVSASVFGTFIAILLAGCSNDQATNEGVAGVARKSPRSLRTPHRSGEYDQGANQDHHDYELEELTELHIRPETALPLSANRR
jgi:hypothetical protein